MIITKGILKLRKRAINYFGRHVEFNALVHALAGIGFGILIAAPIAYPHPVRWALFLLGLSFLGHLFAMSSKK